MVWVAFWGTGWHGDAGRRPALSPAPTALAAARRGPRGSGSGWSCASTGWSAGECQYDPPAGVLALENAVGPGWFGQGSWWLMTGCRVPLARSTAISRVRWPSPCMRMPWKVMLASSSGSRNSGVAIAAAWPPARSAPVAPARARPPTRPATASTGPHASQFALRAPDVQTGEQAVACRLL